MCNFYNSNKYSDHAKRIVILCEKCSEKYNTCTVNQGVYQAV